MVPPIDWSTGHIDPQKHVEVRLKETCMPVMQIRGGKFVLFDTPLDKQFTCLDATKGADRTPVYRSFAPGGAGELRSRFRQSHTAASRPRGAGQMSGTVSQALQTDNSSAAGRDAVLWTCGQGTRCSMPPRASRTAGADVRTE
jgi:hypothetical protein